METGTIFGYISEDINYCPYCGARLDGVNLWCETICSDCGKSFCVVEGESEEDEVDE